MSRLVEFYRGHATDTEARLLAEMWGWKDNQLELTHDFIQWMFPLPEPSSFNPDAPLLTEEDIAAFKSDPLLQANVRTSFQRILTFLGLSARSGGRVMEGVNFAERSLRVWMVPNHNWHRVTRIVKSIRLLGLEGEALGLYAWLKAVYKKGRFPIPADTFQYWTEAAMGLPFHTSPRRA
ncbi:MAG: hypothetical protein K2R98_14775 [Gemmataceae bacterium]|nr:hypothetical protein [Gemmataceae bacterium]